MIISFSAVRLTSLYCSHILIIRSSSTANTGKCSRLNFSGLLTPVTARRRALYGTQWQSDLARALGIDSRRVRQWLNDERGLPDWLDNELQTLLDNKIRQCQALMR
ncbi:hypothetical protein [Moraxella sp. K2450]|uniref:hypothetical protein n=1 Tax=Moraxella sp. K2450 TaxID=2780076 RepID=UPI00187F41E6|nr:hypothetical protein [Moraxella sp. K2450]MBE9597166.1 hypothetical protein [Moraxella sp. K2450]